MTVIIGYIIGLVITVVLATIAVTLTEDTEYKIIQDGGDGIGVVFFACLLWPLTWILAAVLIAIGLIIALPIYVTQKVTKGIKSRYVKDKKEESK